MMAKEVTVGYNEHYGTTHHKYTMNVPIPMINEAIARSKEAGFEELAPWIRAVISRELKGNTFTLQDIIGEKQIRRREYKFTQRRNIVKNDFIKISPILFLDRIRKLMVSFKRSSDQQFFEF